jgi:predicted transposase/invertase (TIGR01784 family)
MFSTSTLRCVSRRINVACRVHARRMAVVPQEGNPGQVVGDVSYAAYEFPFRAIMRDARFDKTFKIILGENKVRTMSFLNAVLKLSDTERIKEIDFMNVSTAELHNRSISFDVKIEAKCQSYSGHTFIVEMQRLKQIRHLNRWVYYGAKELCKIGEITYARTNSVEFYSSLCPVKVITIMDFEDAELKNSEGYLIHWDITERSSKQIASNLLSWTHIILPRFKKDLQGIPPNQRNNFTGKPLEAWLNLFTMKDREEVTVTKEMTADESVSSSLSLRTRRDRSHRSRNKDQM